MCWSLSSAVSLYDFKIVIIVVRDAQLLLSILKCKKKRKALYKWYILLVRDLEDELDAIQLKVPYCLFFRTNSPKVKGYLISYDVKQNIFLSTNLSSTTLIWSNPYCIKVTPVQPCGVLTRCSIQEMDQVAELTGQIWSVSVTRRQWARQPSALSGPDDIISTGSQWCGESSQWLRANGPDVRATWPAPGLRMLPSTEPVILSRGSVVCCSPFLI